MEVRSFSVLLDPKTRPSGVIRIGWRGDWERNESLGATQPELTVPTAYEKSAHYTKVEYNSSKIAPFCRGQAMSQALFSISLQALFFYFIFFESRHLHEDIRNAPSMK